MAEVMADHELASIFAKFGNEPCWGDAPDPEFGLLIEDALRILRQYPALTQRRYGRPIRPPIIYLYQMDAPVSAVGELLELTESQREKGRARSFVNPRGFAYSDIDEQRLADSMLRTACQYAAPPEVLEFLVQFKYPCLLRPQYSHQCQRLGLLCPLLWQKNPQTPKLPPSFEQLTNRMDALLKHAGPEDIKYVLEFAFNGKVATDWNGLMGHEKCRDDVMGYLFKTYKSKVSTFGCSGGPLSEQQRTNISLLMPHLSKFTLGKLDLEPGLQDYRLIIQKLGATTCLVELQLSVPSDVLAGEKSAFDDLNQLLTKQCHMLQNLKLVGQGYDMQQFNEEEDFCFAQLVKIINRMPQQLKMLSLSNFYLNSGEALSELFANFKHKALMLTHCECHNAKPIHMPSPTCKLEKLEFLYCSTKSSWVHTLLDACRQPSNLSHLTIPLDAFGQKAKLGSDDLARILLHGNLQSLTINSARRLSMQPILMALKSNSSLKFLTVIDIFSDLNHKNLFSDLNHIATVLEKHNTSLHHIDWPHVGRIKCGPYWKKQETPSTPSSHPPPPPPNQLVPIESGAPTPPNQQSHRQPQELKDRTELTDYGKIGYFLWLNRCGRAIATNEKTSVEEYVDVLWRVMNQEDQQSPTDANLQFTGLYDILHISPNTWLKPPKHNKRKFGCLS